MLQLNVWRSRPQLNRPRTERPISLPMSRRLRGRIAFHLPLLNLLAVFPGSACVTALGSAGPVRASVSVGAAANAADLATGARSAGLAAALVIASGTGLALGTGGVAVALGSATPAGVEILVEGGLGHATAGVLGEYALLKGPSVLAQSGMWDGARMAHGVSAKACTRPQAHSPTHVHGPLLLQGNVKPINTRAVTA